VSNGVVHGYVRRARLAGLIWPLPEGLDDEGLELLLFPAPAAASQSDRRPSPDWAYVEKELRRRSVTRLLLWEEYRAANPDGFGYTWFCTTFEWTPGGLIAAGEKIGPSAAAFFQAVIAARPHPEQGFRTCLGILSLVRSYDNARVDAACRRGILIKARSVASVRSILKNGLDRAFLDETSDHQPLRHGNIRGQGYFH
jgi:transposase